MTVEEACIVLGIEQPNISEEELKHRFYDAAHLSHPDNNPYNEYAKTKFAMIQEAYLVLKGYIFELPINDSINIDYASNNNPSSFDNQDNSKKASFKQERDPWDAYNEADRKFARMRKEQAKKKAREAFARKEAEDRRYAAYMNSQKTETIIVESNPVKKQIYSESTLKLKYELFMKKDLLFDSLLALFVAIFMICTVLNVPFVLAVSAWGIAILIGRRASKLFFEQKGNVLLSILILLISTEVLMILFKVFLL